MLEATVPSQAASARVRRSSSAASCVRMYTTHSWSRRNGSSTRADALGGRRRRRRRREAFGLQAVGERRQHVVVDGDAAVGVVGDADPQQRHGLLRVHLLPKHFFDVSTVISSFWRNSSPPGSSSAHRFTRPKRIFASTVSRPPTRRAPAARAPARARRPAPARARRGSGGGWVAVRLEGGGEGGRRRGPMGAAAGAAAAGGAAGPATRGAST